MDRFGVLLAFAVEFFRNAVQQEKFFFGEVFGVNLLTGYTICAAGCREALRVLACIT